MNPRFYHLDTCFCPLAPGVALYFPDAFDTYGKRVLKTHVPTLIPVEEDEAHRFGCNAVVVGKTVVHNSRCPLVLRISPHAASRRACAARFFPRRVALLFTFPPLCRKLGHNPSQLVKCFTLGHLVKSAPNSLTSVNAFISSSPSNSVRSTPNIRYNACRTSNVGSCGRRPRKVFRGPAWVGGSAPPACVCCPRLVPAGQRLRRAQ